MSSTVSIGRHAAGVVPEIPVDGNVGHGHVFPREDGQRARCGGVNYCAACKADAETAASVEKLEAASK